MLELFGNIIAFVALLSVVVLYLWQTPVPKRQTVSRQHQQKVSLRPRRSLWEE